MVRFARLTMLVAAVTLTAACDNFATGCAGVGIVGIDVDVRDASGAPALAGAMVVAVAAHYADTAGPVVPSYNGSLRGPTGPTASLAENRGGDYIVSASKPYWTTALQRVRVPGGDCGYVETQHIQMRISKVAGAPAVRSVAVAPRSVRFSFCKSGAAASAYVDADPGFSGDVRWQSEDTTVVTVAQDGIVTVKSRGLTRVSARSVADTSVVGYLTARVEPTCP